MAVQPIRQELLIDGVWTDITSKTRGSDRIEITRGSSGEQANLSAGICRYTLNNRDAYFSNRVPTSANFGKVGRNTQYRLSMVEDTNYLRMLNANLSGTVDYDGARAWTADKAVLDITGDLDVRFDGNADYWYGAAGNLLAAKYLSTGDQRSWAFYTDPYGFLYFSWTSLGTSASRRTAVSTVPVTPRTGRVALRATLDVDNGAAGATVTFYTADTIAGNVESIQVPNGTFESGTTTGWTPFDATFDPSTAQAHTGTYSGLLTVVGSPSQSYVRPSSGSAVTPGSVYRISMWLYSVAGETVFVATDWYDGGFGYLSTDGANVVVPAATWTLAEVDVTAPGSAAFAGHGPTLTGSPSAGTELWVDDVDFSEVTWTALGAAVTSAGTSAVFASTANLEVGTHNNGAGWHEIFTISNGFPADVDPFVGRVYGFELYSGIAGTLVADFDATSRTPGDTSWSDGLGTPNTWALVESAEISDADYRFWGEQAALPNRWDTTGTDVYMPAQSGDIIQRLTNGQKELKSAIYRNLSQYPLDGYWTGEDQAGATRLGAVTGSSARIKDIDFGPADDFPGTSGCMTANSDSAYASGTANFDGGNSGTAYTLWYFKLDAVPAGDIVPFRFIFTGGNVYRADVQVGVAAFTLTVYNSNGAVLHTGAVSFGSGISPDAWLAMRILYTQDGANVDFEWAWYPVGAPTEVGTSGTFAGTIGRPRAWQWLAHTSKTSCQLAHVVLDRQEIGFSTDAFKQSTNAHAGETVVQRFRRLCAEESIPGWFTGLTLTGPDDTARQLTMGPQLPKVFIDLLKECADVDGGILYAPRDRFGIGLLPLITMINRDPLELDYSANVFSGELRPTPDDFQIRNDVTAVRPGGSFARWERDYGPLNTNDPADDPDGVGVYDVQINRNVETDSMLLEQAQWDSALGTWDEDRYTQVQVELHRAPYTADAALAASVTGLDIGKPFAITNPPAWLPPEDIRQYIRGYFEVLQNFTQTITWNTAPYGPYRTGLWDGEDRRYDSNSTTLAEDIASGETAWDISTTDLNDVWSTTSLPYFWFVGGERVEVTGMTAVAGTGPYTQTATVVRSIAKTHASGTEVHIDDPGRWALGEGADVVAAGDPTYASDINQILNKPICRLIQAAAQSIAHASDVPVQFGVGSEDIDTHGFHDESTNNTRITPTVAGYYRVDGVASMSANTDYLGIQAGLRKNGAAVPSLQRVQKTTGTASATQTQGAYAILSANGSTDYFELQIQHTNTAAAARNTNPTAAQASTFEVEWLRPL